MNTPWQDILKKYLAQKYSERNLCLRVFSAWAMLAKIQASKRKMDRLQLEKEETKKKVDEFLDSLGNINKSSNEWLLQKVKRSA